MSDSKHEYERWLVFGPRGETEDTWLWCLHCERAYQIKDIRVLPHPILEGLTLDLCAYEDCDGDSVTDAWSWPPFANVPNIPEKGVLYSLNEDELGE